MQTEILYRPAYAMARVHLDPNEEIQVEAGAMVSMSSDIAIETQARGGLIKSLARSMLGGESFFINTYRAARGGGTMTLAPALPGDMFELDMKGDSLLVQSGSYVASSGSVEVDTRWGGGKTFFASEGLVLLHASGSGPLILSSYGAIDDVSLGDGERLTIDTGHLVAFSERIGFNVRSIGGMKSTLFSGEGLVVDLSGPGRVLMQTRSQDAFLAWLIPQLPSNGNS
jgi:uncharacterized protein (TIGR00266 family)